MFTGTTPTYVLTFPQDEVDFTQAQKIVVTIVDNWGNKLIEKGDEDLVITENTIEVYLSQEETLNFNNGPIKIQVNWLYSSNEGFDRACSTIEVIDVDRNLHDEVIQ